VRRISSSFFFNPTDQAKSLFLLGVVTIGMMTASTGRSLNMLSIILNGTRLPQLYEGAKS
jgi:hypothetical protein